MVVDGLLAWLIFSWLTVAAGCCMSFWGISEMLSGEMDERWKRYNSSVERDRTGFFGVLEMVPRRGLEPPRAEAH